MVELPGRGGATYVTDTPGPDPDSPTLVLLHALGCTGLLTWYPAIEPLSRRYRVVTLDLRWHGQGIQSDEFSLYDCADDVAALIDVLELEDVIVAGYSMGSIVAQRVWRQHPDKIQGLVLCATTDRFQLDAERAGLLHRDGRRDVRRPRHLPLAHRASRGRARLPPTALDLEPSDIHEWALREFRSTSPWAVGQALAALGRHHSRPWIGKIDVPTAVVVGTKDHVIRRPASSRWPRRSPAPPSTTSTAGHALCVLESEKFVPGRARGGQHRQRPAPRLRRGAARPRTCPSLA